jgi:sugar (pentulose or hexulose) kinase
MKKKIIISIDIGTTNTKVMAFDEIGRELQKADKNTPLILNRIGKGWMEQDVNSVWDAVCECTKKVIAGLAEEEKKGICGVGVTALRQSVVPIDNDGNPLRYAIVWGTKSVETEIDLMRNMVGERQLFETTGLSSSPVWAGPFIVHIIKEQNTYNKKLYKILEIEDYILFKLGSDVCVSDFSQAGCISLFDIFSLTWSREICERLEIDLDLLPKVVPPGTHVGKVNAFASKETGIPEHTPIITGGGDCQTSALGCGVTKSGSGNVVIGTAAVASIFIDKPLLDEEKITVCQPHSMPYKYILDINNQTGGNAYSWLVNLLKKHTKPEMIENIYDEINREIEKIPVGSNGLLFLPHLVGATSPYWDDKSKGIFYGLTLNTKFSDLARSVIEGVCIELSKGISRVKELGIGINQLIVSGGACRRGSPWNKIQADVYGMPIIPSLSTETTSLGCAALVATACGIYGNLSEAVDKMVKLGEMVEPNMENHRNYLEIISYHDELYKNLKEKRFFEKVKF